MIKKRRKKMKKVFLFGFDYHKLNLYCSYINLNTFINTFLFQ